MMASVTPLFRCRCGKDGRQRTLVHDGIEIATAVRCDDCVAREDALLDRVRPVFEAMLAAGVERPTARDVVLFLLERMR